VNPLKQLQDCGQSIWLDYIRPNLITSGEFQRICCFSSKAEQDPQSLKTRRASLF
jgi:hypothetical protein